MLAIGFALGSLTGSFNFRLLKGLSSVGESTEVCDRQLETLPNSQHPIEAQLSLNQTLLATLNGHLDWILSVTFSPDGKTLVSGGRDGAVAVWQLQQLHSIIGIGGHYKCRR
ncbi:MAG: hypothetical protein HC840_25005 [Leptolyngbyaceae cyanobacterium RM2_2_4]|nr:hypothetical protein [Leptolyngbyaceae cyanobacterium SM1_4_3]NJN91577.1 hypothetical protein [Leptolyngbyaceae cyanobacterium SL_5_14]NJO52119.1 hypothetical protein [Leptolyngbyaceae cyanobacterium RM2_2_4]